MPVDIEDGELSFCVATSEQTPNDYGILAYRAMTRLDKTKEIKEYEDLPVPLEPEEEMREGALKGDFSKNMFQDTRNETDPMDDTYLDSKRLQDLMLIYHYKFGHISMERIKRMATLGYLPKQLASCEIPICTACVYGKMTRRPWRGKPAKQPPITKEITAAGQVVSVDQLESPVDGLVGQLKGALTTKRYKAATVYVDHYSKLSFVYLQHSTSAVETLESKEAFEQYADSNGVKVLQYHADNGRFAENIWRADIAKKQQQLTFSGVGAHHQNGRAPGPH
jgi:hypothetical protein